MMQQQAQQVQGAMIQGAMMQQQAQVQGAIMQQQVQQAQVQGAIMQQGAMLQAMAFKQSIMNCFSKRVQLWNLHGKFLISGDHRAHGHHNPHHGFQGSSIWIIEKHGMFNDRVSLFCPANARYLCHEGGRHIEMHHNVGWNEASWHMEDWGAYFTFRSHHGHYLGIDKHDSDVHAKEHYSGNPHMNQQFELRYV